MQPSFNKVRHAKRARYDAASLQAVLSRALMGHVGFIAEGRPMVIPMLFSHDPARGCLYLHGASKTRLIKLGAGAPLCLTVSLLDALVIARSAFHHSCNYRAAVVHGYGRLVEDPAEKRAALWQITDHLLPGRTAELREMTAQELKATGVLALEIDAASVKSRSGPPVDEAGDLDGSWAGLLPLDRQFGAPLPDEHCADPAALPASLAQAAEKFFG